MALLLAVDTATSHLGVALLEGDTPRATRSADCKRAFAEFLLAEVDAVLAAAGVPLSRVEAFAVSIGPGSFTGLRVGLATVKGLAFGSACPVAPVPTLAALAAGAEGEGPVAALLDAQRDELYAAAWADADVLAEPVLPEGVYGVAALAGRLPPGCRLVGEDAARHAATLGAVAVATAPGGGALRVGRLGARLLARGGGVRPEQLLPRYVRRAEAEARRTGRATEA